MLEHIADADGAARGLAHGPRGPLVTGYPLVSRLMTKAFAAIGYPNIDEDHVSAPVRIAAALARAPLAAPPSRLRTR